MRESGEDQGKPEVAFDEGDGVFNLSDGEPAEAPVDVGNMETCIEKDLSDNKAKGSPLKRAASFILNLITIVLVVFVVALLLMMSQVKTLSMEGVGIAGFRMLFVQTPSMTPTYPVGSVVFVKEVPLDTLKEGDVISFLADARTASIVSHRIVRIEEYGEGLYWFTTKGDMNPSEDPSPVDSRNVIGRVFFGSTALGFLISKLRTVWGLVVMVILPSAIVIAVEIVKLVIALRENKRVNALGSLSPESSDGEGGNDETVLDKIDNTRQT